ncbi:MAG: bifunctional UDP-N-acetylglucosamine diphosphorylase/glucosamine-1-phosphate N-acetyltransferase GlmU [Alphaproteobacteria bacterium]|nr:bifunctional UDP-N-acetylglucosamine diphosphorylase/glucosamine-1-phosphate N-acetyltransferase GlmU [Alphaproteobacteria bacterium]
MTNQNFPNSNSALAVIILAAGKGSRMKSALPKVMHEIAGRPMINWLIETVEQLNPEKIIVVTAPDMGDVKDAVAPHQCVIQKEQLGTGDAVKPAMKELQGFDGKILVLMGDEPFLDLADLQNMISQDGLSVMAIEAHDPHGLGRMVLKSNGTLDKIVEEKDASDEQRAITLCNAGNFCFPAKHLGDWLEKLNNDNKAGEYYLTDIPAIAAKDGVETHVITAGARNVWGINTRLELAEHERMAQIMLRTRAMQNGVTMIDPDSVTLSWDTTFGQDIIIQPHVFIGPGVSVGDGTTIRAFSHIEGTTIGQSTKIGPFARLRPGSSIEEGAAIGNFIEVNRSTIKAGAKSKHVSYIGDTTIGEGTNIGAGTIIANYDGFYKHKSEIGKNVFIGSNSTLISPVVIGEGAIIAAGSNINKDVPANAMGIGRSRQENHNGWASEYRKMKQNQKNKLGKKAVK